MLKLALTVAGVTYARDHDLCELNRKLQGAGYTSVRAALLQDVDCIPGQRYGEAASTSEEAMAAQSAALEIVADVAKAICDRGSASASP